jgi:hypothetical protein
VKGGRKEGRKGGRKDGWKKRRRNGWMGRRKEGRKEGRRKEGRKEGRKEAAEYMLTTSDKRRTYLGWREAIAGCCQRAYVKTRENRTAFLFHRLILPSYFTGHTYAHSHHSPNNFILGRSKKKSSIN